MGKETNELPLHKKVHFRRNRELIRNIAIYEKFNPDQYDLFNLKVYETSGDNLRGKNVKYNTNDDHSCWLGDNHYEVFEVPSMNNRPNSPYGEYLFLAHNSSSVTTFSDQCL